MGKTNLSTKAYNFILNEILEDNYTMGSPISELEISKQLSISRSPVREAIRLLEAEGILVSYSNRGTFVTNFSTQDIREIFELRQIFERMALRNSFDALDTMQLKAIKSEIEQLDVINIEPDAFYKADKKFHEFFIHQSKNFRLIKFYQQLMGQISVIRRISARNPNHFVVSTDFHLKIIQAILDKDLPEAELILFNHIQNVQEETEEALLRLL